MPYLRATMIGDTPGCKLSAAISRFCSAVQRRRRSRPVITSIRRLRLLVRSVVGASSAANATAITPSSSLKDDRWRDSHRVAQCAAATPLTLTLHLELDLTDHLKVGSPTASSQGGAHRTLTFQSAGTCEGL